MCKEDKTAKRIRNVDHDFVESDKPVQNVNQCARKTKQQKGEKQNMHKLQFNLQITTFVKEMKALRKMVDGMTAIIVSLKTRYNDKTYHCRSQLLIAWPKQQGICSGDPKCKSPHWV